MRCAVGSVSSTYLASVELTDNRTINVLDFH